MTSRAHSILRLAGRPLHQKSILRQSTLFRRSPASTRGIVVLGIETSADDTCAALLRIEGKGENRVVYTLCEDRTTSSNIKRRGIDPYEAVVSHTQHLSQMIHRLMYKPATDSTASSPSASAWQNPDLVAVTRGPGMASCLGVGVTTAKALAVAWSVPIVGVHHMQAHALTPMMEAAIARGAAITAQESDSNLPTEKAESEDNQGPKFPFLTLLISGKHTMLVHSKSNIDHRILCTVENVAMGDMLDKIARDLVPENLIPGPDTATFVVYPKLMEQFITSEPEVASYAPPEIERKIPETYLSPRFGWTVTPPIAQNQKGLLFDFAGFGGIVRKIMLKKELAGEEMCVDERRELATQTMKLAFEHVARKVLLALRTDKELLEDPPKHLILSGGVASNLFLRKVIEMNLAARGFGDIKLMAPAPRYCTDNAPMIAFAGVQMYEEEGWETSQAFTPIRTWSMEGILTDVGCWVKRPGFGEEASPVSVKREEAVAA